jgi:hypothetical protein
MEILYDIISWGALITAFAGMAFLLALMGGDFDRFILRDKKDKTKKPKEKAR